MKGRKEPGERYEVGYRSPGCTAVHAAKIMKEFEKSGVPFKNRHTIPHLGVLRMARASAGEREKGNSLQIGSQTR